MIPKEILKKVRRLEITTRGMVNDVFSGEYHSVFKGRGIEFSEVREYSYGDDIRTIDWNVTARFDRPFVKVYEEERELAVFILFDTSSSTLFGSQNSTKRDMMIELAALFSFSAVENNDRVGALLFSDTLEKVIPPKKDRTHALRILRELVYNPGERKRTDLKNAFDFINSTQTRKSIVFVLSDFFDEGYEKSFKMMAKQHDVIPIVFQDPLELQILEHRGLFFLRDMESGNFGIVDTSSDQVRENYRRNLNRNRVYRNRLFTSTGIDFIELRTDEPYIKPLFEFFHKRAQKL